MVNIDLKDRRILYELDINSRQSYNKIAKNVGLSKDSVIYRIKNLQAAGIIKQFHTIIDVGKLGYISYRLYLKLQNTTPEKEEEIIEFIKNQKVVGWLVSIDGEYDLGMWILAKSVKEANQFWKALLRKYVNYFAARALTTFTKVAYFPRAYLLEQEQNQEEYVFVTEPEEIPLDEKDKAILEVLAPNARLPILDIAKKLGITPKTAAARIRELEKKKVIIGYRTMFDLEKLGYHYFKVHFLLHNVTEEKERALRQFIKQHPNIIFDNEVLGGDDIEIEIQVNDLNELRKIITQMKEQYGEIIKESKRLFFYKEHKFLFLPV